MPRVPTLTPQVQIQAPNVPAPQIARPPEEAFGGGVARAAQGLASQAEKSATVFANHLIDLQQKEDERNALELQNRFQIELQDTLTNAEPDETGIAKGFLSRQLNQANGSVMQYDETARQIKRKYMEQPVAPFLRDKFSETLNAHLTAGREQVVRHEASQRDASAKQALKTNMDATVAAAAAVRSPEDLAPLVASATRNYASMAIRIGLDPATVDLNSKVYAGLITKSAIDGVIETDPRQAQNILDGMKGSITPSDAAALQKMVDGKVIHEESLRVWNTVSGMRLGDGNSDIAAMERYVYKLPVSAEKRDQIFSYVKSKAAVEDAIRKDQIAANDRAFANEVIQGFGKGLTYDDANIIAVRYGRDANDIATKQNEIKELYTGSVQPFDTWINKQPEEVQGAWAYAVETVKGKYGTKTGRIEGYPNKVKLADAAISELKQQAIGKSATEIRDIVNEKMSKVVVSPGWFWDTTEVGWKVDAGTRSLYAAELAQLEKTYGATVVSQARQAIIKHNLRPNAPQIPLVPDNIKAIIEKRFSNANKS